MQRLTGFTIWTSLAVACAVAAEPAGPLTVPSEAEQKAAVAVVAEVYKPDYEKAKTPAQKLELARKLLLEGTATKDDLRVRYVLFRIARDIAALQGDLETAFDAIDRIDDEYAIDSLQQRLDAATIAVKALRTENDKREAAGILQPLAEEALALDRFELATDFTELALTCAREGRVSELVRQLTSLKTTIQATATEFVAVQPALNTLEEKPTDASANAAAGKFYAIAKGDWERGVPMLALGNDALCKEAAVLELAEGTDPLKMGDAWWKVAESLEGARQREVQIHAAEYYRAALPKLSGLTKTRVERALATLPAPSGEPKVSKPSAQKYPSIAGSWRNSSGRVYVIHQTGNQFKGTMSFRTTSDGETRVEVTGTVSPDGRVEGMNRYTQAPPGFQPTKLTGTLSADGKSIRGKAVQPDGVTKDLDWTLVEENPFIGMKRKSVLSNNKTVFVISSGGKVKGGRSDFKWQLKGEHLVIYWDWGEPEMLTLSTDRQSATGLRSLKGKSESSEWRK